MLSIFIPLYIYPLLGIWEPLASMADTYPNITFRVVINPNSGPGNDSLPDINYISALEDLRQYPNVHLLGYVQCLYGERNVSEVQQDVISYSNWPHESATTYEGRPPVSLDGIFFDEVPSQPVHVEWMSDMATFARTVWATSMTQYATVVYNPGNSVDDSFYPNADFVVAFEQSESNFQAFVDTTLAELKPRARRKTIVILHSYNGTAQHLRDFVMDLNDEHVGGLFVTDQLGGVYNEWPILWDALVSLVDNTTVGRSIT